MRNRVIAAIVSAAVILPLFLILVPVVPREYHPLWGCDVCRRWAVSSYYESVSLNYFGAGAFYAICLNGTGFYWPFVTSGLFDIMPPPCWVGP